MCPRRVIWISLLAAIGFAQDPVVDAAEQVVAAHSKGDDAALARLATDLSEHAWLVADGVWRVSPDAARAFAAVVPGDRGKRIARFFDRRGATSAAVNRLLDDLPTLDPIEALERMDTVETDDPLQEARLSLAGAALLAEQGEENSAAAFLEAVRLLRKVGWVDRMAAAAKRGASIARRTDQFEFAVELLEAHFEAESMRGNKAGQADALLNLGGILGHLGDYQGAIGNLERAERLATQSGAIDKRIAAMGSRAIIQKRRGRYRAAIGTLETAIQEAESHRIDRRLGHLRSDLGLVYQLLGAFEEAERQHRTALAKFESIEDRFGMARAWGDLGVCYLRQHRYVDAKNYLLRASAFFRRKDRFRATVLLNLGDVLGALGEIEAARDALKESTNLARALRTPWHEGQARHSLGRVEQLAGQPAQALVAFDQCLALADRISSHLLREKGHLGRAQTLLGQGEHIEALEASRAAMDQVARQVLGLSIVRSAEARARHAEVYAVAARAALGADASEALFEVLEKSRAAAFLEAISDREALRAAIISDDLREPEEAARREVLMTTEAYRIAYRRGLVQEIRRARKKVDAAQAKLDAIHARIQRDARSGLDLLYPHSASLTELRSCLSESGALVSYAVLDEVIAVVITKSDLRIARLGESRDLLKLCRGFTPKTEASLKQLRKVLVDPLMLEKDAQVIVSPDGALSRIPLSAVLADWDVVLVPSASVYALLQQERAQRVASGRGFLAVGISRYDKSRDLESLDHSEEEARKVGDRVLLGARATEPALRETLKEKQRWRAVHFACHGRFDAKFPLRSALALTATKDDDGWLTAAEIFATPVPADLVVLASCEGGRASFVPAEGLIGFTRAFLFAGASRVISSAWTVDDEATREFMMEFYLQWNEKGQTTSRALRLAREYVRSKGKWSEPRFWAGWQLWGLPD